jgi:alpha/beta superfamily hydrolase
MTTPAPETRVSLLCGPLRLDGRASIPTSTRHAVVVCHPHPEYGGTMDDAMVTTVAGSLGAAGIATLRFNFRGVGQSEGRHGAGVAEVDDVRAALDWLAEHAPGARLALAGYSFGAAMALRAAVADPRPERVVAIALPAAMLDVTFLADCRTPTLFVHGDRDQFSPPAQFDALLARCPAETQVVRIPGADHFLYAHADRVGEHVVRFVTGT